MTDLEEAPWRERVRFHFTQDGTRARLEDLIPAYEPGAQLYTCGSARYMDAIFETAAARGWPEEALHREYFSVPEAPDHVNHPFLLRLERRGIVLPVPADKRATDVLAEAGIPIDTKCSDGICGVCATRYLEGEVEHRDYVLSHKEREHRVVLCCSRAKEPEGEITIDL